jgi:PAS domain S-box-containing protein
MSLQTNRLDSVPARQDGTRRDALVRYGVAIAATLLAIALRGALAPLLDDQAPVLVSLVAVVVSAAYGGFGPGLLATAVGLVVAHWFFFQPAGAWRVESSAEATQLILFAVSGVAVSWMGHRLRWLVHRERQSTSELHESEERLRLAQAAGRVGTYDWDVAGQQARCSDEYFRAMGRTPQHQNTVTFAEWRSWLHPEDREQVLAGLEVSLAKAGEVSGEYRVIDEEQGVRWICYHGKVTRAVAGNGFRVLGTVQEITAEKTAQEQVRAHAELLTTLFDNIPVLLCIWEPKLQAFRLNRHTIEVLGWSEEDANTGDFMAKVYPDPEYRREVTAYMQSLQSGFRDMRPTAKDGSQVAISWANVRLSDDRSVGIGVDIRPRLKAEQALRENKARLALALEAAYIISFEWNIQRNEVRRFISVDEALPPTPANAPSTFEAVCSLVHPEDRSLFTRNVQAAIAHVDGRYENEFRIIHLDGSAKWLYERGIVQRDNDGKPVRLIGVSQDITPRKSAEERLRESESFHRQTLESVPGLTFTNTPDGLCDYVSRQWVEFTGVPASEQLGEGWVQLLHPDDRSRAFEAWRAAVEGRGEYDLEFRVRRKDGAYEWFKVRGRAIYDDQCKVARWFGTGINVENLKRTEATLLQAQAELAEANQQLALHARDLDKLVEQRTAELREMADQLESFSYSIAHDLRAPLRSIQSFATILEEEHQRELDARGRDYLRRIVAAGSRMDRLISDVLDYSRLARSEVAMTEVNVQQLIAEILRDYPQELAAAINVDHLPNVLGNPALLTQVFYNLLGNALKFAAPGRASHVSIRAENASGMVRLWIEDNGIGIAPENRDELFGLFRRLHNENEYPGTGIGLATVKKATERMGGRVGVESELGVGSRFWVELSTPTEGTRNESSEINPEMSKLLGSPH